MQILFKLFSRLSGFSGFLAGAVMFTMMIQISLDVLLKYCCSMPIPGTLVMVSSYYMAALIFLPLGIVTRDENHLEVELFTQGLGPRKLAFFKAVGCLIGLGYVGIMLVKGFDEAVYKTQIREIWETATRHMDVWPARWFFPLGCLLMEVFLLLHLVRHIAFSFFGIRLLPETAEPLIDHASANAD
ncbi:TRAP transporter small permease [Martelella lutilitoris]|nr:TRAP transporter small permease subunit [Martelella lutilitoris]